MRLVSLVLALAAIGCSRIDLEPVSEPPPSKRASVHADDRRITISQGVALAVECVDTCDGPCRGASVKVSNPEKLQALKAYHLAGVEAGQAEEHNAAVWVLVGAELGSTRLRVKSSCTDDEYEVKVVE